MKRVLELGQYVAPAYAGMILAEQGHRVRKWTDGKDPILGLRQGDELWAWINAGKAVECRRVTAEALEEALGDADIVVDNFQAEAWTRWGIDPDELAIGYGVRWVSLQGDVPGRSFDIVAQARAVMDFAPYAPYYLGDTTAGLWMAFKALVGEVPGRAVLRQASLLAKLVEGELVVDVERERDQVPWDTEAYHTVEGGVEVEFRGETIFEPVRDRRWKLANLAHREGRIIV